MDKLLDLSVKIVVPVMLGWLTWVTSTLLNSENRLTKVEENKYTISDSAIDKKELNVELRKIISSLAVIEAKLPVLDPPEWFIQRVDKLEVKLDKIETLLKSNCNE